MGDFSVPRFNREIVCISDDAGLAASVSSFVGEKDEYVAVVTGPRMKRPDAPSEVIRRCNACAKVRARQVVLAGLDEEAEQALRAARPDFSFLTINSVEDIRSQLGASRRRSLEGVRKCRRDKLGAGLLSARQECNLLVVDDGAPDTEIRQRGSPPAAHVVVIDDTDPLAQVVAANYAFSLGADLAAIPQREDTTRDQVYQELDERFRYRDDARGERALGSLNSLRASLTSYLTFGRRDFVTFITRGLPYGYFYREAPSTHLFSYPHLGELIIAGIYAEETRANCLAAVLVDPAHFPKSEISALTNRLAEDGVVVEVLAGESATVDRTTDYIYAYPYDLLFICSHCGELPGIRSTVRVPDREGHTHIVEVEETLAFGSHALKASPSGLVTVQILVRPVAIDGALWHSAEPHLRRHYEAILQYLRETPPRKREILTTERVPHAQFTTAIVLSDGAFMLGSVHSIDPTVSPVVFNNACVSYYDAAHTLTFAGARSYVGTLAPVRTEAAEMVAETTFTRLANEETLALALCRAQSQVFPDPDDRTYVHVGCHFNTVRLPHQDASGAVIQRISDAIAMRALHVPSHEGEAVALGRRFLEFLSRLQS